MTAPKRKSDVVGYIVMTVFIVLGLAVCAGVCLVYISMASFGSNK